MENRDLDESEECLCRVGVFASIFVAFAVLPAVAVPAVAAAVLLPAVAVPAVAVAILATGLIVRAVVEYSLAELRELGWTVIEEHRQRPMEDQPSGATGTTRLCL